MQGHPGWASAPSLTEVLYKLSASSTAIPLWTRILSLSFPTHRYHKLLNILSHIHSWPWGAILFPSWRHSYWLAIVMQCILTAVSSIPPPLNHGLWGLCSAPHYIHTCVCILYFQILLRQKVTPQDLSRIRDLKDVTTKYVDLIWLLIIINQPKKLFWENWGNLNMDWVVDDS